MPKNLRVLAKNVRVFYKCTCFIIPLRLLQRIINVRTVFHTKTYVPGRPIKIRYFNRPGLEARLYLKHLASDRVASIQGRLESRLVTERLAQKANY